MADEPISSEVVKDLQEAVDALPESAAQEQELEKPDPRWLEKLADRFREFEPRIDEAEKAGDADKIEMIFLEQSAYLDAARGTITRQVKAAQDYVKEEVRDSGETSADAIQAKNALAYWEGEEKRLSDYRAQVFQYFKDLGAGLKETGTPENPVATNFTPETQDPQKAIDLIMKKISEIQKKLGEDAAYAMRAAEAKKISDAVKAK